MATICRDYRLLFIHGRGTASTAIRQVLHENLGGTEVPPRTQFDAQGRIVLGRHANLPQLLRHGAIDDASGLEVATAVRNPFDYLVSTWLKFRLSNEGVIERPDVSHLPREQEKLDKASTLPFDQWVEWRYRRPGLLGRFRRPPNDRFIQLAGATFVMRFESIQPDFDRLLERVGYQGRIELDRTNQTPGREHDYRQYYTKRARRLVEQVWATELDRFGYAF
jgi:hypothetical protein